MACVLPFLLPRAYLSAHSFMLSPSGPGPHACARMPAPALLLHAVPSLSASVLPPWYMPCPFYSVPTPSPSWKRRPLTHTPPRADPCAPLYSLTDTRRLPAYLFECKPLPACPPPHACPHFSQPSCFAQLHHACCLCQPPNILACPLSLYSTCHAWPAALHLFRYRGISCLHNLFACIGCLQRSSPSRDHGVGLQKNNTCTEGGVPWLHGRVRGGGPGGTQAMRPR